jgi:UPF0271 protein
VKPHGALYNRAVRDAEQAAAIVRGVLASDAAGAASEGLPVLSLPGSMLAHEAERSGLSAVGEAFVDRGYQSDGTLVPRARSGAVLDDPEVVAERAVDMAWGWPILDADGGELLVVARSLCVHGDTDGAVDLATAVREALQAAGVEVRAFAGESG